MLINSALVRIVVIGVLNSWEIVETKLVRSSFSLRSLESDFSIASSAFLRVLTSRELV